MLTERQELILQLVVDAYLETGRPVGSKAIAEARDVEWSASTVRAELAALEARGLLTHPHTSAGRMPDRRRLPLLRRRPARRRRRSRVGAGVELELSRMRREVDEAMRETTTALSQVTDLVALVTAPPLEAATIHRVEALLLQPQRRDGRRDQPPPAGSPSAIFTFDEPVDPGLVEWASEYLNERLSGLGLGARMIAAPARRP